MLNSQVLYSAQTQTTLATCPDCRQSIRVMGKVFWGRKVTCPNCDTQLRVIETTPVEFGLDYEEWDVDEDDW
jgi:hypothetical protein